MTNFKLFIFIAIFSAISIICFSQTNVYFVEFSDKNGSPHSIDTPQSFLSQRAIDRRTKFGIKIDQKDIPNNPDYLDSLSSIGASRILSLKWLQGALVYCSNEHAEYIRNSSFVSRVEYLNILPSKNTDEVMRKILKPEQSHHSESLKQIEQINLKSVHDKGYTGKNIHIAIIDAGYLMVDKMDAFRDMRNENRLLSTKDFVNPYSNIFSEHVHGTIVLSTMTGVFDNQSIGTAPDASFHLIRSENYNNETPSEMYYWVAAAEYADSVGADIITTSLGYRTFDDESKNLSHSDLDGYTSPCSKAAQIASEKGIVVLASAGNDGNVEWRKISVPADAKDIITVGAVDSNSVYAPFSSVGYSADGRVKPDIMARGAKAVIVNINGELGQANGTSFSCPIAAGMVACIMEAVPSASNMQIVNAVRSSGSQYSNPDSLLGYGIPNAEIIINTLKNESNNENYNDQTKWSLKTNPVHNTFSIKNLNLNLNYAIYNNTATIVQNGTISPNEEICINSIKSGIYILFLHDKDEHQYIKMIVCD